MARGVLVRLRWVLHPRRLPAERQMAAFAAHQQALGRAASRNRPAAA